jgi:hypothetical protein
MSKVSLSGNASGTGTFTIASPNSNTDRTLTLPDATGTLQVLTTWSVTESGGVLFFSVSGVNKAKLDASGNLTVTGNVTAYGTV